MFRRVAKQAPDLSAAMFDLAQSMWSSRLAIKTACIDGIVMDAPANLDWSFPILWECKTMNAQNWRDCVKRGVSVAKPVYAAQMAIYQAYMESTVEDISRNPALFTAINKDTQELWFELLPFDAVLAQRSSDRAVKIITATEHGELLPRSFSDPTHHECKFCAWQERCWAIRSSGGAV